ncbi:unnamed protein product [Musa textilis]
MLLQRCSSLPKAGSSRSRFRGEDELLGSVRIGALGLMEMTGASAIQSLFLNLYFLCSMPLHSKMQAIHLNRRFYTLHLLSLRFPFCHRVLHLLFNLLTPSSPEVPVAKLLFTSLDTNCKKSEVYKLQSYQFYPGSPNRLPHITKLRFFRFFLYLIPNSIPVPVATSNYSLLVDHQKSKVLKGLLHGTYTDTCSKWWVTFRSSAIGSCINRGVCYHV